MPEGAWAGWLAVELLCSSVLLFEALAKLRVWGWALRGPYWASWRNRIDFVLMAAPLAAQLRCAVLGAVGDAAIEAARLALSLRMLRLTRLMKGMHINGYEVPRTRHCGSDRTRSCTQV